jgi:hypothetical protein
MFDFDDIKNDITTQSTNLEDKLVLNSFNPIVTFFNFYREYLPYINEDTNYDDLVPGGIYKLDIVDYDNTIKSRYKHYTIAPHRFINMCCTFSNFNKLFKSINFESYNFSNTDNIFNILYNKILLEYQKHIYKVDIKYFDLFAIYIIRFNNRKASPLIYLSYIPDIEISELLPYIYKIYDLQLYSEINNEIKSCNFDYYNSYYNSIYEYIEMKSELNSMFNDIRRGNIIYFKYNDEHYFINHSSYLTTLNDLLTFDFKNNLHYKENNFTHVYTKISDSPFLDMMFMYVTSPCNLPEFYKYIEGCNTTIYNNSPTILKVKISKSK